MRSVHDEIISSRSKWGWHRRVHLLVWWDVCDTLAGMNIFRTIRDLMKPITKIPDEYRTGYGYYAPPDRQRLEENLNDAGTDSR